MSPPYGRPSPGSSGAECCLPARAARPRGMSCRRGGRRSCERGVTGVSGGGGGGGGGGAGVGGVPGPGGPEVGGRGFGGAAPGVWTARAYLHGATADMLERLGLSGYADLFRADHLAFGDLAAKVAQWWDLARTERLACDFVTAYEPVLRGWAGRRAAARPREALADYVRGLPDRRRLPLRGPGLPAQLRPARR